MSRPSLAPLASPESPACLPADAPPAYALVTNLLQAHALRVLEDWIDFLGRPPTTLHCYCGGNAEAKHSVAQFCAARDIALVLTPDEVSDDVKAAELPVLHWQYIHVTEEISVLVHLDALPFRTGEADWLDRCLETMEAEGALFATGSVRPFRTDQPLEHAPAEARQYRRTQRLSNNFIVMRPAQWLALEARYRHLQKKFGRFYPEGFLEQHCQETGAFGLRLMNRPDWRVFHVQVWDERMWAVREQFRAGRGIRPFITGYEDDQRYEWTMYYMHPKPPLLKRVRIELGRLRRKLLAG